jgi:hypothetical protein
MRFRLAKILLCTVALLGASGACSKTNNVDQSKETTNNVFKAKIGDKGGPVGDINSSGAWLPPHAIGYTQEIVIRPADEGEYPALPDYAAGNVYSFEPHGLDFNTEVDVYLPLPEGRRAEDFMVWHASVGGEWKNLGREESPSRTSVRAQTLSFSYFVLVDGAQSMPPDGSAGGPVMAPGGGAPSGGSSGTGEGGTEPRAGKAGVGGAGANGGVPGSGGVPGNGGVPGSGGSGGSATCMVDDTADTGSCEASGEVSGKSGPKPFAAMDGFAVVADTMPPQVTLVFTNYPMACGAALGMHGSTLQQNHMPTGLPNSELMSVYLELDDTGGETSVVPGQYPRAQKADQVQIVYVETDAMCKPYLNLPQPAPTRKLSITEFDTAHVAGTLEFKTSDANVPFTASFDFPRCPLEENAAAPCCAQ